VPIGPWGPNVERLAVEKRDVLVGLAITELGSMLGTASSRRDLNRTAVAFMRKALDNLEV
jgi:hypothetical protein